MSNLYTIGQMNEVADTAEAEGMTPEMFKRLSSRSVMSQVVAVLRGDLIITKPNYSWDEENGVIRFSVTSNGKTGPEWEEHLKKAGHSISDYASQLLHSDKFVQSEAGTVHEVVILKGELFTDNDRYTKNIRKEAKKRNISTPNVEIACLIRDKLSNKEIEQMGLTWIVTMHEPIQVSDGSPNLLYVDRLVGSWLFAPWAYPDDRWDRDSGFVFVASQVSPERLDPQS